MDELIQVYPGYLPDEIIQIHQKAQFRGLASDAP